MAATVELHCWADDPLADQGALGAGADLCSADNCAYSAANRIAHPIVRGSFSFEKWIRAKFTVAPANWVGRFRVWGDGTVPADTTLRVGHTEVSAAPIDTASSIAVNDFSLMVVGAEGVWDMNVYTAGDIALDPWAAAYLVFQLYASSTATPGDWGPVTIYYSYEEV